MLSVILFHTKSLNAVPEISLSLGPIHPEPRRFSIGGLPARSGRSVKTHGVGSATCRAVLWKTDRYNPARSVYSRPRLAGS